ncbi:hypothetical protein [uncultured Arcticibacterium sp.]|uniref:hypothetical protein n=1 Tax=uncultured Arcticibacterium sp. TaxID=2173042 RepID=UPI0030F5C136
MTGEITDFHIALNEGVWTRYKYTINSITFRSNENTGSPLYKEKKEFIGKKFPVICSKKEHEASYILILKRDFEEFGLVRPDSLNWICDSLNICD